MKRAANFLSTRTVCVEPRADRELFKRQLGRIKIPGAFQLAIIDQADFTYGGIDRYLQDLQSARIIG